MKKFITIQIGVVQTFVAGCSDANARALALTECGRLNDGGVPVEDI